LAHNCGQLEAQASCIVAALVFHYIQGLRQCPAVSANHRDVKKAPRSILSRNRSSLSDKKDKLQSIFSKSGLGAASNLRDIKLALNLVILFQFPLVISTCMMLLYIEIVDDIVIYIQGHRLYFPFC
jgi:hypothetical protein